LKGGGGGGGDQRGSGCFGGIALQLMQFAIEIQGIGLFKPQVAVFGLHVEDWFGAGTKPTTPPKWAQFFVVAKFVASSCCPTPRTPPSAFETAVPAHD